MRSTADISTVPSAVRDLREVPLAALPTLGTLTLDKALERAMADSATTLVPAAAFQSAI